MDRRRGEGRQGERKTEMSEVKKKKLRHKGHTHSLPVWKGSWHRGPVPGTQWFPICETHAYPWQTSSQDSPSLKGSRPPPNGSCLPVLLMTLGIPLWSLLYIKPGRHVTEICVLVKIALFDIPGGSSYPSPWLLTFRHPEAPKLAGPLTWCVCAELGCPQGQRPAEGGQ